MPSPEQSKTTNKTSPDGARQYATFFIEDLFFGIDVLQVQEVLRYQEMTGVPAAPDVIQGLINLRGQIVTAVDMRRRLGVSKRREGETPMNVVVRSDDGAVSLLVDEIGDVLEVSAASHEPVPESVPQAQRDLILGVHKLEGRLLLVLDTERVLQTQVAG